MATTLALSVRLNSAQMSSPADEIDEYADDDLHDDHAADTESAVITHPSSNDRNAALTSADHAVPLTSGPESSGLNAIHSSYLQHIRTLQKTNSSLQKKIDYLSALQNDLSH